MSAVLRHFSISTDDLGRARTFYGQVCGWTFESWGPPDFLLVVGAGKGGSIQGRHTVGGRETPGVELTFAVDDIAAATAAVEANGGRILMPEYDLERVGRMITFEDPEGAVAMACQYHDTGWTPAPPSGAIVRHFAINADDPPRVRAIYEAVFGWTFTPRGPPDFHQVRDVGDGVMGALQARRAIGGERMPDIELTLGVADLEATVAAIEAYGGRLLAQPFRIEGVGELAFFRDSEGNIAGAMQYDEGVWE
jgi:predicted enzyme related to lactoylglutathione lyase